MDKKNFETWLSMFRFSIADFGYYVDFRKVYQNVESIKIELSILSALIGSKKIEEDFENIVTRYPETLRCIPVLLAVRATEIYARDDEMEKLFQFGGAKSSLEECKIFMRKTGLFDLIANHLVSNLWDYVTGVEAGLDSNGRKNRGGHLMENLVEKFIRETSVDYYKEMYLSEIETRWNLDLSALSNEGKTKKRFDFVVKTPTMVYGIETNFYGGHGGGSKLNETARSYKMLSVESDAVEGFTFVWITDGTAWASAKNNLRETFDVMEHIYCIQEMEDGVLRRLFV